MADRIDPYAVLQVIPTAHQEVLQAAYRSLARLYHPDHNGGADDAKRMVELNRAWRMVGTPTKRAAYDATAALFGLGPELPDEPDEDTDRPAPQATRPPAPKRRSTPKPAKDGGPAAAPAAPAPARKRRAEPEPPAAVPPKQPRTRKPRATAATTEVALSVADAGKDAAFGDATRGAERAAEPSRRRPDGARRGRDAAAATARPTEADTKPWAKARGAETESIPWESGVASSAAAAGSAFPSDHAGPPPGNPSGSILDFGRYKGWSLGEIARIDRNYLEWFRRMPIGRRYQTEIDDLFDAMIAVPAARPSVFGPLQRRSWFGRRK